MSQPITAKQLGNQLGLSVDRLGPTILKLAKKRLLTCLNPHSRRSRIYWLTHNGIETQKQLLGKAQAVRHDFPAVDWEKYGSICFSHRQIVVKTLREPLQPATIKRHALRNDNTIRFSANNCRDSIRFLRKLGIVQPVTVRKRKHPLYELTEEGKTMQRLLWQAEVKRF